MQAEWVGLRPMVYDDLPVIDRVPGKQNLLVAGGHGMLGISMAPATRASAAQYLGRGW